jgi:hypothetical protein
MFVLSDPPRLDPESILPYLLPKFFFWYLRGGTTRWLQSGGSHGPYTRHSDRNDRSSGSNDRPESWLRSDMRVGRLCRNTRYARNYFAKNLKRVSNTFFAKSYVHIILASALRWRWKLVCGCKIAPNRGLWNYVMSTERYDYVMWVIIWESCIRNGGQTALSSSKNSTLAN